jgi:hypothetical protein
MASMITATDRHRQGHRESRAASKAGAAAIRPTDPSFARRAHLVLAGRRRLAASAWLGRTARDVSSRLRNGGFQAAASTHAQPSSPRSTPGIGFYFASRRSRGGRVATTTRLAMEQRWSAPRGVPGRRPLYARRDVRPAWHDPPYEPAGPDDAQFARRCRARFRAWPPTCTGCFTRRGCAVLTCLLPTPSAASSFLLRSEIPARGQGARGRLRHQHRAAVGPTVAPLRAPPELSQRSAGERPGIGDGRQGDQVDQQRGFRGCRSP